MFLHWGVFIQNMFTVIQNIWSYFNLHWQWTRSFEIFMHKWQGNNLYRNMIRTQYETSQVIKERLNDIPLRIFGREMTRFLYTQITDKLFEGIHLYIENRKVLGMYIVSLHQITEKLSKSVPLQYWELRHFAMPETCNNGLGLVNSCVYYAHQTREINQALPHSVDFKASVELWNPLSKIALHKCSFIWEKRTCKYLKSL